MTKRILFLITFFVAAIAFAQEDAKSPEAGQAYNAGNSFAKSRKYEQAIEKYLEAIKHDNNFPGAYFNLAYCYEKTSQPIKAEASYKSAINIDGKFEKAYVALGNLQLDMDKVSDARNTFNAVIGFDAKSAKANYGLGKVYYKQKDYDNAIKYLNASIENDNDYEHAYNYLGLSYNGIKQYSKAAEAFGNAFNNTNNRTLKGNYLYRQGEAYVNAKDYDNAEKALLDALDYSKKSSIIAACNFYLGDVYKHKGQTQKAIQHFQKAANNRSWKQPAEYEIDILKNPDKYSY